MKEGEKMRIMNEIRLDFPAIPENESLARMVVSAFLVPLNPTIEELADVKTAVSEAVTNAIVHGYAQHMGTVRLHASFLEDGLLTVDGSDRGCGIADVARAREPCFTTMDGMGFTVMESFMDGVEVQSAVGKGTTVRLTKRINLREECLARRA